VAAVVGLLLWLLTQVAPGCGAILVGYGILCAGLGYLICYGFAAEDTACRGPFFPRLFLVSIAMTSRPERLVRPLILFFIGLLCLAAGLVAVMPGPAGGGVTVSPGRRQARAPLRGPAPQVLPRGGQPQAPPPPAQPPAFLLAADRGPCQYLADLPDLEARSGPWPFSRGTVGDPAHNPVQVLGVRSPKGLGMHPPDAPGYAFARYRLGKRGGVFKAAVAINDTSPANRNPAVFEVYGDGRLLWQSAPVPGPRRPQECRVDVAGVDVLELRVRAEGSHWGLHAVWFQPRIVKAD
jgi:hypothetical protein